MFSLNVAGFMKKGKPIIGKETPGHAKGVGITGAGTIGIGGGGAKVLALTI